MISLYVLGKSCLCFSCLSFAMPTINAISTIETHINIIKIVFCFIMIPKNLHSAGQNPKNHYNIDYHRRKKNHSHNLHYKSYHHYLLDTPSQKT